MAKIIFLGTCAGTEPIEGMNHSAFAVESNGIYYWFDAGEGCSRTAHLMGVDLLNVKAVFISHTHLDHVGGLENLLWNIRKLSTLSGRIPVDGVIKLFIPNMETWDGMWQVLKNTEHNFECDFDIEPKLPANGTIYSDNNIKVSAVCNTHLGCDTKGSPMSYSYIIELQDKKIVYSGDLGHLSELEAIVGEGCDILICETGHQTIDAVCSFAEEHNIDHLLLSHNGRSIINDPERAGQIASACRCKTTICSDRMIVELAR